MKHLKEKDLSLDMQVVSILNGSNNTKGETDDNCNQTDKACPTDGCPTPTVANECNNTVEECVNTMLGGDCLTQTQQGDNCNDKTKIVECLEHTNNDCPATNSNYLLCCENTEVNTCVLNCQGHQEESIDICAETKDSLCAPCSYWETCLVPITETTDC